MFDSVSGYRKKIVVLLAIVTVGSAALMAISSRLAGNEPKLENSKSKANSLFINDPNFSMAANNSLGGRELFFKMILSILLVVVLGIAAIYVSKKFLPHANLSGKRVRLIETVHLGLRKAIHLLKIGNQHILIGSTAENITKLADVTGVFVQGEHTFADLSAQEADNNSRIKNDLQAY